MRILMVGAGATGGFYGGKLLQAGRDVTFLLREGRAQQIREHGLHILPYLGEPISLRPNMIVTAADLRKDPQTFDLIIISTKSYQLEDAMNDIAPAVGPHTMLLPVLNGMRHLAALDACFGADKVLGGSVRVVSYLDEDGRVIQMNALDQISYGERSRERPPRILAVDAIMQNAGFHAMLQPDIVDALWQKWSLLASMGAICILARGNAGQVGSAPRGAQLARAVVEESAAIAAVNGYPLDPTLVAAHIQRMTEPGSALTSSLYRDMMKGAPVEADHILGDLLDRTNDGAAPLLTAAYVQLKVYEAGRSAA